MKRFLVLLTAATIGLGIVSDGQAQILRRRGGCGVSSGCNVGSSGCNVSSSRGCNLSPAVPAAVSVPVQLPQPAFVPSAVSGAASGQAVQRLFQQAAGCENGSCPIEQPAAGPSTVPGPSDSTRSSIDVRSAMAFCNSRGPARAALPAIAQRSPSIPVPTADARWSSLIAAFR
jgi:hypothetical protein